MMMSSRTAAVSRSPTPQPSFSPTHLTHHRHPALPPSKRDKRRNALAEKLERLTKTFHDPENPRSRDKHYRGQVSHIQVDMQLISKADTSGRNMRLMDDSAEAIQNSVDGVVNGMGIRSSELNSEGLSGGWYARYLREVNDCMEERDTQLTLLSNSHRVKSSSLAAQHTRSILHAREEHKSLQATIRARLSTRFKSQLKKLAAEKESSSASANALSSMTGGLTDISDSNALHLHPSQFGLAAAIGSPRRHGGQHFDDDAEKEIIGRRKRRRAGEVEELMAFGAGMNFDSSSTKRKRRVPATDSVLEDVVTPIADAVSPSANPQAESSTQSGEEMQKKREEILKQVYNPIYSLEKLFTDKELALHSNQATLATLRFFSMRMNRDLDHENADDTDETPTGANTPVPGASVAAGDEDEEEERGRGLSPFSELTRGLPSLPGFAGVSTRSNPSRQFGSNKEMDSLLLCGVPGIGMSYVNKTGIAPPPPGLRGEDAEADMTFIRGDKRNGDGAAEAASKRKRG